MNEEEQVWEIVEKKAEERGYRHKSIGDGTWANNSALIAEIGTYTDDTQAEWARRYPEYLSVYVCNGTPGDPLIIGNKAYVLFNKFLAVPAGSLTNIEEK